VTDTRAAGMFPEDFRFGAATAAYQIEGAAHEDGRGDSIWDVFCRVPGAVVRGEDGEVACDHYHRYRDDVRLMAELGLQSYRFSTSWARIRPDGKGVNRRGLDFYSRLVDELLEHDIAPWLTLYHWDLPQALEENGGWTNRDTAYRFVEYAASVHDVLGDRIGTWTTLNEPWCSAFLGYLSGEHAPGRQDVASSLAAAHHLLLAHGLAVRELRARDAALRLGVTLNLTVVDPVDPASPGDRDAARRIDGQFNRIFLDPLFRGEYPDDVLGELPELERFLRPGDLPIIQSPIDTLGVNYYHGEAVSSRPSPQRPGSQATARPLRSPFPAAQGVYWHSRGLPRTAMGWEVQPEGLTRLLVRLKEEYGAPPIYITENGAADDDQVRPGGPDGGVVIEDADRLSFIDGHLRATYDAIQAGVDVRGYFAWSLLDNFEWAYGYGQRFGIVHVDYETQVRTPKASARWYADVARSGVLPAIPPA
jgi:beta-glucosidase